MATPSTTLLLLVALVPLAWPGGARAQCPAPSELLSVNGTRVCAQLYADSSPYYDQCCGGGVLVVTPDQDMPYMPRGWVAKASSLVVGTRCELSVWSRPGKNGKKKKFGAGAVPRLQEVKKGLFGDWDDSIKGLYCQCK